MSIPFLLNFFFCALFWLFGMFINISIATPLWVIPSIISSWVLTQYALLLNNIYLRFRSINAMIIKLGNLSTEFELKTVFKSKTPLGKPITRDIININYVSMKLCQVCEDVENFYAIPTLLTSIYFIFSTILSLYLEIPLINTSHIDLCAILIQISCSSWFSMVIINFVTLVSNTVKTTREFKKLGFNIHLLLDQKEVDLKTEAALIELSRDLLHRKIEFSIYGMISLDGSLLQVILGTIITYLVILIQTHPQ
ncbi:putative gustatory receptor 28a [Microplitis mediator]|uniref:putative gustatory receptor 28a n=1 Tax=Microplitis mediator TaxID=375433 RepID=UPI0025558C95|nr:putative gustatory receptor 28a [Microplitis mediator]